MNSQNSDVGKIKNITRYPIKSMGGESIEESIVTSGGLLGDRSLALIDESNSKVASAKMPRKWSGLLDFSASFVSSPAVDMPLPNVQLIFPGGKIADGNVMDMNDDISKVIGRTVRLTNVKPKEISLERLDPLVEEETILDIGDIMMEGRFSDYAAIHLVTSSTLKHLSQLFPDISFDYERFRANLLVETDDYGEGFVENEWVGKTIRIGDDIHLRISDPTPRCAIPTLAQYGGVTKDPSVLRAIVEKNSLPVPLLDNEVLPCVGVYAFVISGGVVRSGDSVRVG